MSNKREREKRREARLAEEAAVSGGDRRKKLLQLAAGVAFLVVLAVGILIVVESNSSDGGDSSNIQHAADVDKELRGIPQQGLVLGEPKAPVELIEFGDLQCPVCKAYSEEVLPQVIDNKVRSGEAKIAFRNFTIIGEQSTPAGAAALAAGAQGRGWNYLDLFYRNQGKENSGYADDAFLTAVAKAAGVKNISKWDADRKSSKFVQQVENTTAEAQRIGFTGTPSYAIKGPNTNGMELLGTPSGPEELESAIKSAS